jgi:hypothetical protein
MLVCHSTEKFLSFQKSFSFRHEDFYAEGILGIGLIDYLGFYVPLKNISLIWRRHHCRWRAAKVRSLLGAQDLWAGRDLYRTSPAVTRDLGFFGLIRRTAPFSHLLRHMRGCGGSILTRILKGLGIGQSCFKFPWSYQSNCLMNYWWEHY